MPDLAPMDSSYKPFTLSEIQRESIKLLFRNGKINAFTIAVALLLYSAIFLIDLFSTKLVNSYLLFTVAFLFSASPAGSEISIALVINKGITDILRGAEMIFFIAYSFISFFTIITTIVQTAAWSYNDENNIPIKDLIFRVAKSWTRSFLTWFHVAIFGMGYAVFVFAILLEPLLRVHIYPVGWQVLYVLLAILAFIYYLHMSVVWVLAIVISAIEKKCFGIEALGKAAELVKGNRIRGFILNFSFVVLSVIFFWVINIITVNWGQTTRIIVGFFMIIFTGIMKMLQFMAYTVIYLRCKKENAEEVKLQGIITEYTNKTPTVPLPEESLPLTSGI